MTLFEAIRELREGQAIVDSGEHSCREGIYYRWAWGQEGIDEPGCQNYHDYSIVDLPKPKMTLEEGLEKVERDVFVEVAETDTSTVLYALWSKRPSISKAILSKLRSLPIDWQAEADRKEDTND